jgi:hypothetical protein
MRWLSEDLELDHAQRELPPSRVLATTKVKSVRMAAVAAAMMVGVLALSDAQAASWPETKNPPAAEARRPRDVVASDETLRTSRPAVAEPAGYSEVSRAYWEDLEERMACMDTVTEDPDGVDPELPF